MGENLQTLRAHSLIPQTVGTGDMLASDNLSSLANAATSRTNLGVRVYPPAVNAQTGDYTLVLGDAAKIIEMSKATALTLTIPLNATVAYPVSTLIDVYQTGAGTLTIAITATGTLHSPGAKVAISAQYGHALLYKQATDTWLLTGDLA